MVLILIGSILAHKKELTLSKLPAKISSMFKIMVETVHPNNLSTEYALDLAQMQIIWQIFSLN